jgi:8-oxo-dGTP pyrophosphatase MutT (NUDIX family)
VSLPVAARRPAYRLAYRALQLFWLVRRPVKVGVKCLVVNDDRILLVRHTYGNRAWDLPGGSLHRHEQPLTGAQREMREELGVRDAAWTALGIVHGTVDHRRDTIHCYRAELPSTAVVLDRGELQTAAWFAPGELPADLGPYVTPIVTRAA